jgi:rhodanese-related sulfurtransferase
MGLYVWSLSPIQIACHQIAICDENLDERLRSVRKVYRARTEMNEDHTNTENFPGKGPFAQLPKEKWDELTRAVENRIAAPGTFIFRQGDPMDRVYVIRSGKVRMFRTDSTGVETDLAILGPGESFGQMTLLTGEARTVTAEVLEETHLIALSKEQFEGILKDYPDISLALVRQVLEWLLLAGKVIQQKTELEYQYRPPKTSWRDFVLIVGVSVMLALLFNRANPNKIPVFPEFPDKKAIAEISVAQASEEVKKGEALFLDARPNSLYQKRHIRGAANISLSLFDIAYVTTFEGENKEKKIIVYGGTVSKLYDWDLASKLRRADHKNVSVLKGGISAWEKAGYPVEEEGQK